MRAAGPWYTLYSSFDEWRYQIESHSQTSILHARRRGRDSVLQKIEPVWTHFYVVVGDLDRPTIHVENYIITVAEMFDEADETLFQHILTNINYVMHLTFPTEHVSNTTWGRAPRVKNSLPRHRNSMTETFLYACCTKDVAARKSLAGLTYQLLLYAYTLNIFTVSSCVWQLLLNEYCLIDLLMIMWKMTRYRYCVIANEEPRKCCNVSCAHTRIWAWRRCKISNDISTLI